jgi:hypothetical protein
LVVILVTIFFVWCVYGSSGDRLWRVWQQNLTGNSKIFLLVSVTLGQRQFSVETTRLLDRTAFYKLVMMRDMKKIIKTSVNHSIILLDKQDLVSSLIVVFRISSANTILQRHSIIMTTRKTLDYISKQAIQSTL